ncbi:MAG: leucine-rich repeat protein, partial [Monoglobaceae bacterium]
MKKSLFKIVSLMLALGMLLSLSAISVSADDTTISGIIDSLTNGTYSFDSTTGVLDISGTGALSNGTWQSAIDIKAVNQINLHNGITEVPMYFTSNLNGTMWKNSTNNELSNLATVTLPNTLTKIGQGAFINAKIYKIMTYTDNETSTVEGFPSKLTEIGGQGFQSAVLGSMTNGCLVIPASVTKIDYNAFINAQYLRYIIFEDGSKLKTLGDNVLPQSTYWSRIIVMPDGVSDASTTVKANNNNTVYITRNAEFKKSFDAKYDALSPKPKNVDCYVTNRSNLLGYGIINNKGDELRTAASSSGSTQAGMWLAIGSKSTEDAETYDKIELHIVGSGVWKADYGWGYKYLVNSAAYVYPTPWNVDGINCQNINKMVIHNGVTSVATKLGGPSDNLTAKLEEVVLPCGLETIGQLSFGNQYSLKSFSHFSEDGKTIIPGLPTSTLKKIENSAFQNCKVLEPTDGEAF